MNFSSIQAYLDPSNWQQHPNSQPATSTGSPHLPPAALPPPPPHGGIRPGSLADRARMANIPMPEAALKCPRCESTNTKFCYFNNYSLSQPRHFCKTCRRYWTRGGALRSVPVGGGCRRNKKSKGKSPVTGDRQTSTSSTGGSTSAISSTSTTASMLGLTPQIPPHRFMAPLSQFSEYGGGSGGGGGEIGINYGGIPATSDMNFQLLGGGGGGGGSYGSGYGSWAGLDFPSGLYPFQGGIRPTGLGLSQPGSVKMEENGMELNLSRQFLGIQGNESQFWNGGSTSAWSDFSGFGSSSTTNHM